MRPALLLARSSCVSSCPPVVNRVPGLRTRRARSFGSFEAPVTHPWVRSERRGYEGRGRGGKAEETWSPVPGQVPPLPSLPIVGADAVFDTGGEQLRDCR